MPVYEPAAVEVKDSRDDRESRPAPAHTRIKLSWTADRTTGYTAIVTLGDLARALLADQEPSDPNTAVILDDLLCQPGRKLAALLAGTRIPRTCR
jgi:hypothetical protein